MKKNPVRVIVILFLIAVIGAFHLKMKKRPGSGETGAVSAMQARSRAMVGQRAPDFRVKLIDGGEFSMSESAGSRIVILNFFSARSAACAEEMAGLNTFCARHAANPGKPGSGGDLEIVAIGTGEPEGLLREFASKNRLSFPVGADPDGEVAMKYGITDFPSTVLVGPDGRIGLHITGPMHNAAVSLEPVYRESVRQLERGKGIRREKQPEEER